MVTIGINMGFGNLYEDLSDEEMYRGEIDITVLADKLGYDNVFAVEHHFTDYSMCPDNFVFLAHVAGLTKNIKLGTGAVIVPWNNPLRVAEKALMLDTITGGRFMLGVGRGLSRKEYVPFNIPLDETRDRFDEAVPMIFEAIETGVIEGHGPYYPQPRTELRPAPRESFEGRKFVVAGSPSSMLGAAKLKTGILSFITRPVAEMVADFTAYRKAYEEQHGELAPPITIAVNMFCHEDQAFAEERNEEYRTRFFYSNVEHYEMAGDHFATTKGYERYAESAKRIQEAGLEASADKFAQTGLWGTPERILGKIEEIRDHMGEFALSLQPAFGGMPYAEAAHSLELFAREVMPVARTMQGTRASVLV